MIAILDYGYGNIKSIFNALKFLELDCKVIYNFKNTDFKKIILPGVGAFGPAIESIKKKGLDDDIKNFLNDKTNIMLGICLGMQLLANIGNEETANNGLNLIDGETKYLKKNNAITHHVGWNNIQIKKKNKILKDIREDVDFYFCHSVYFDCNKKYVIAESNFNLDFPAVINKDNIFGIQFHPEKSLVNGVQILKNFSSI